MSSMSQQLWKLITPKNYSTGLKTPGIIDILEKKELINCYGKRVDLAKVIKNTKMIAYYFSASWCNPCKQLLPKIKALSIENKKQKSGLEIIFISSDQDSHVMLNYFLEKHGDWFAVPFGDPGAEALRKIYEITHIPQIIVVTPEGKIISRTGVKDIETLGSNVLVSWNVDPK